MFSRTLACFPPLVLVMLLTVSADAQQDRKSRPAPGYSSLINIPALIDNHARLLARRYDLSDDQALFTEEFLRQRTEEFLAVHEDELYGLVDDLFAARSGQELGGEAAADWGQRALPLYEEAKLLIIAGNEEWREILTPEQREIHDRDLADMYEQFDVTEEHLERVAAGDMTLRQFLRGTREAARRSRQQQAKTPAREAADTKSSPGNSRVSERPRRTSRRGGDVVTPPGRRPDRTRRTTPRRPRGRTSPRVTGGSDYESQWEAYVRQFIERYKLNEGQIQQAEGLLKDCKELAERYVQRSKSQLERIDKEMKDLASSQDKDKLKEMNRLKERRDKLLAPVNRIFESRLKPRLERLPTSAQRREAETSKKTPPRRTPSRNRDRDQDDDNDDN